MSEAEKIFEYFVHAGDLKQKFFKANNDNAIQGLKEFRGTQLGMTDISETAWFGRTSINDGTISILDKDSNLKDQGNFKILSGGGWANDVIQIAGLKKQYSEAVTPNGSIMIGIHASYFEEGDIIQFKPASNKPKGSEPS